MLSYKTQRVFIEQHVCFIQNESYRQSLEKTKNNDKHGKRDNINAWFS